MRGAVRRRCRRPLTRALSRKRERGCRARPAMLTILLDGVAYGMLLFVLAAASA